MTGAAGLGVLSFSELAGVLLLERVRGRKYLLAILPDALLNLVFALEEQGVRMSGGWFTRVTGGSSASLDAYSRGIFAASSVRG